MYRIKCMDLSGLSEKDLKAVWYGSSEERRAKAKRFYHPEDAKRCLTAGILL